VPTPEMARTLLAGTWLAASALGLHAAAVAVLRLRRNLAVAGSMEG
jgi:hypothetical protein